MSTKNKLVLLTGAALLYFLYKKHMANRTNATVPPAPGNARVVKNQAQLYRSKNGGVYYRDAQGRPVWLTVPRQGYQIPQEEVVRYAPDYSQYRGPAPVAPKGYRTELFSTYDNGILPPGPRR